MWQWNPLMWNTIEILYILSPAACTLIHLYSDATTCRQRQILVLLGLLVTLLASSPIPLTPLSLHPLSTESGSLLTWCYFVSRFTLCYCVSVNTCYLGDGMEQWIAHQTVVPFVVQLLGSSPLQHIRSPKNHVYDWLIDWRRLSHKPKWLASIERVTV